MIEARRDVDIELLPMSPFVPGAKQRDLAFDERRVHFTTLANALFDFIESGEVCR